MVDIGELDGLAQAELVRKKLVTPVELLDAAIERTDAANASINAVVDTFYERARQEAGADLPDGPFRGVPFLLKHGGGPAVAGERHTSGSRYLKDYIAPTDGELTRRYRAAGLVIYGKTNLPEFGLQPTTEPELHGATLNPWDTTCSAGGSSGGAAAAVASRMVPMANGSDSGGSIRVPASCCGVFGLKPTRLRTSSPRRSLGVSLRMGLLSEHALTISVRDSAALLDATAGPLPGDPFIAPAQVRPYLEETSTDPGRLRIAFSATTPSGAPLHPDCVAAVEDAARLCSDLGHELIEDTPKLELARIAAPFQLLSSVGLAWDVRNWERKTGRVATAEEFEAATWASIESGRRSGATAEQLMDAQVDMQTIVDEVASWSQGYDLWLTPTTGMPAPELGSFRALPDDPMHGVRLSAAFLPYTMYQNVSGQPAMSVPLYWNADGIPIGAHFVGPYGDEGVLFRLAAQLEQARPWGQRRPPLAPAQAS